MRDSTDMVHLGRDGWLFLTGGTNRVRQQYRASLSMAWRLWRWRRLIEARSARAAALGMRAFHVVVPEKLSIYDDRLDGLVIDPALSPARRLGARLARSPAARAWIDLVGPLRAARDAEPPLYLRTDTHWSQEGCRLAFGEIMRALGAAVPADIATRPFHDHDGVRDLGAKLDPAPTETMRVYQVQRDAVRVYANPLVEAYEARGRAADLHAGAHVVFRNASPAADPRTLMLFGDSCSHFHPIFLTGLLAESFRELHFVWSASLDWSYVERVRPHLLLVEVAERFLARVPVDGFDVVSAGTARLARLDGAAAEPI
ncbi:hypothetical protein VQ02_30375 [Methylobacterium variabile]|jgi:hypothetical protein|uniref:AlgX/AlgJ SGNH hydrolase-like domain-containing protein n=1 Tax=Methylobacterium variabile TaxID=298794 RepID=A0A0J6S214_9HYPH|nr:hypothetical protein [Methylobacterium variabile]KMO29230.1 hypothetical protein VQ02_30375 [Methylobacterium variabile]